VGRDTRFILPALGQVGGIHQCLNPDEFFRTEDGGCKDLRTGLVWSLEAFGSVTWGYARDYGDNLVEGGFHDWRQPTVDELSTAFLNGAPTHFAYPVGGLNNIEFWSSENTGKRWAMTVELMSDGEVRRRTQGSALSGVYVREAGGAGGLTVTGIDPNSINAGTSIPVTIDGSGFDAEAIVTFENGKGAEPTATVTTVTATTIDALVSVGSNGPPRNRVWDVRVTNPDSSTGVLEGVFEVRVGP
jgi:hypothetical protein